MFLAIRFRYFHFQLFPFLHNLQFFIVLFPDQRLAFYLGTVIPHLIGTRWFVS